MPLPTVQLRYFSSAAQPILEVCSAAGPHRRLPFVYAGAGRTRGEGEWFVECERSQPGQWQFRIDLGRGRYETPVGQDYFRTGLSRLWLQDRQIFDYRPAPFLSPARVEKIEAFAGSLPARPIYVYVPRGYAEQTERTYPVLYMHDGQNCFAAYAGDSFAGSWRADETASWLISQGRMAECVIVAVGHGQSERIVEYLPPYVTHRPPTASIIRKAQTKSITLPHRPVVGRADQTAAFYRYEVADYIGQTYRVRRDRAETATCGSSMGGLFSLYLAWEWTDFARQHAVMSPSLWMTRSHSGPPEAIERLRSDPPRDVRLWLDSGTQDSPDQGDDGMLDTRAAYEALLENGYRVGPDFQYHLDEGASHSEAAWAARLPLVFQFLFPLEEEESVISNK